MKRHRLFVAAVLGALLVSGCMSSGEATGESVDSPPTPASSDSAPTAAVARTIPPPVTPAFLVTRTQVALPERCSAKAVSALLRSTLRAFNEGDAAGFAQAFIEEGFFQPYVGTFPEIGLHGFEGREKIEGFVTARHEAGDGWTAERLEPPRGDVGLPREAVFGLRLQLSAFGQDTAVGGAKVVIDCASGLVDTWVGPPTVP